MSLVRYQTEFAVLTLLICGGSFTEPTALRSHGVKSAHFFSPSSSIVLPTIEAYEVKRDRVDSVSNNGVFVGKSDSSALQMVNISRNSDLLFGEVTGHESALLLHCHAPYSVQWIFRGDSDPEFNTNTTTKTDSAGNNIYSAYLCLGSTRNLNERETGQYICTSVRNKRLFSYLYLFVTRSSLFTNKGLETIYYSERDNSIRIPCSLSEPRATTTLQKSENGVLKCPMDDSVRFDAKEGFTMKLNPKRLQQPQGTYLCIADYNNTFQVIKYNIVRDDGLNNGSASEHTSDEFGQSPTEPTEFDPTPSPTTPTQQATPPAISDSPSATAAACANKTCGANAFCKINKNGDAVCRCQKEYIGNPYVECKHKSQLSTTTPPPQHTEGTTYSPTPPSTSGSPAGEGQYSCESYDDCPNDHACIQSVCQDPCHVNSICGPNTYCESMYHTPFCKCKDGYEGDPYSSQQGQQCEKSYCDPNPCGPNSICKYVNGIISCTCKPGFSTHNDGVCRPSKKKGFKPEQFKKNANNSTPLLPQRNSSLLPPGKECHYDIDCPDDQMCIQDKCENPCINACGSGAVCHTKNHFPRCLCPEGSTGDPFYKCVPLFSELLGTSSVPPPLSPDSLNEGGSSGDVNEKINCGEENSPCGPNTVCQASRNQFVCVCPNNFIGDPYSVQGCTRKSGYLKCGKDSDCPHFLTCLRHQGCVNPCNVRNVCQDGLSCVPFLHRPACLKTDNFDTQYPRDELTSEHIAETVVSDFPLDLNTSDCFTKIDGRIISPCGKNSICYDDSSLPVNGFGKGAIFCGCLENYTGDPYVACEPLKECTNISSCGENQACLDGICTAHVLTNNSANFTEKNITTSGNPCSPSPCTDIQETCVIIRSNFSAKCLPLSENIFATIQPQQTSTKLFKSDICKSTGICKDEHVEDNVDEAQNEEEITSITTTEIPELDHFTIIPFAASIDLIRSSAIQSSFEEYNSNSFQRRTVDTFNSNENISPLSEDEGVVVDA